MANGGDGYVAPVTDGAPEPILLETPTDASATEAELAARIDAEASNSFLTMREGVVPPVKEAESDPATGGTDPAPEPGDGSAGTKADDGASEGADATKAEEEPEPADLTPEPSDKSPEPAKSAPQAEVLTIEVEDVNGKKYTLKAGDSLEEALADFEPKNNGQIMQIVKDLTALEVKQEQANAKAAVRAAQEAQTAERNRVTQQWDNEIVSLQKAGMLDKPKAKVGDANFLEDPAVKRVDQVFKYMTEENTRRAQAGEAPLTSFRDAFKGLRLDEIEKQQTDKNKLDNDRAKQKAGMIGGGGTPVGKSAPVYRAGQAQDIWDVR